MERTRTQKLSAQIKRKVKSTSTLKRTKRRYDGDAEIMISTGSTLLDLAISGGRKRGGGIPGGILVEIFGPESSGKTVLLCESGGDIQRKDGELLFHDPEARLNKQFAQIFDLNIDDMEYTTPDTITAMFKNIREWNPQSKGKINGILADSLAALSTDLEMGNEEGDKMGGRRAKEFSEQLRKACRIIKNKNYLMICSNQLRDTMATYGKKHDTPGGWAIKFYSSLRIEATRITKLIKEIKVSGKLVEEAIGIKTIFEIVKNNTWKPYRNAPVYIIFDYGIDDVRANLQFIKDYTNHNIYTINNENLDKSLERSIRIIEQNAREEELREQVIDLWEEIEDRFSDKRKKKQR